MNSNFNDEQIRAYASAFEEGDAIWCDGKWHEVTMFGLQKQTPIIHLCMGGNPSVVNSNIFDNDLKVNCRVTTLADYELQGGEKLVRLGENALGSVFGKVYKTVNSRGGIEITDDDGYNYRPLCDDRWGVIPRYEQVKHSDNPPKKKPKFKVGDKVTVVSVFTGVVESFDDKNDIYGVKMINKEGESHIGYYWEQDLSPYVEEPKIKSSFERETKKIIKELHDTLVKKNADYGNSFTKSYEKWGVVSAIIRMEDKFNRLNQLYDKDSSEVDESLYDTVLDLAGYAILTARELKKGEGSGQD